jgi:hypothetical protein
VSHDEGNRGLRAVSALLEDPSMKKLAVMLCAAAVGLVTTVASADESTTVAPGTVVLKPITVTGRADKPHVQIILTRATAASAAGSAHDGLRERLLAPNEPHMSH